MLKLMRNCLPIQLKIVTQMDVIACRQNAREIAVETGFGLADQTRFATAVSELARNALVHGGGGCCTIVSCKKDNHHGICMTIEDAGAGIADIGVAMQDGYTTSKGSMGMGLPAAKRLVHSMEIESEPGKTIVSINMYLP